MRTDDAWEQRVLANFMEAGRIKQIPARRKKRRVVLQWLAEHFRPAERYPEAQVNDILRRYHEDFALLRRLLVDEELMQRQAGAYWRAGTLPHRPAVVAAALATHLAASPSRIDPAEPLANDVRD